MRNLLSQMHIDPSLFANEFVINVCFPSLNDPKKGQNLFRQISVSIYAEQCCQMPTTPVKKFRVPSKPFLNDFKVGNTAVGKIYF